MAVITDYASLKSAVQVWAVRPDTVFGNQVPLFVEMAEARLYNGAGQPGDEVYTPPLRTSVMEVTATVTLTAGVATMPTTALEIRRLYREDDDYGMTYETPERFKVFAANNTTAGDSIFYTVEAGQILTAPIMTDSLLMSYYRSYDPITTSNTTGPLIAAHGTLYLEACLFEAFTFLQEGALAGAHLIRLRSLITGANRTASSIRAPGPKRIRIRNNIP